MYCILPMISPLKFFNQQTAATITYTRSLLGRLQCVVFSPLIFFNQQPTTTINKRCEKVIKFIF